GGIVRWACLMVSAGTLLADSSTEALCQAVRAGDLSKVDELLTQGVPVTGRESMGGTALHGASVSGRFEVADRLLRAGAEVDVTHTLDRATPLHYAVSGNQPELVELLLEHGANPDTTYGDGLTALHLAAGRGYSRIAAALVAHGAKIDVRSNSGATALEDAVRRGAPEVVRL